MEGKYEPDEERDLPFRRAGDMPWRGEVCRPGDGWVSWVRERSNERDGVSRSE